MNPSDQPLHGQAFVVGASLFFLVFVIELVRRRKIGERLSLLWIMIAVGMVIAATVVFPLMFEIAPLIGVVYPASALFLLAFLGIVCLSLYFTVLLSQLGQQSRVLAQRVALLEDELHEVKELQSSSQ